MLLTVSTLDENSIRRRLWTSAVDVPGVDDIVPVGGGSVRCGSIFQRVQEFQNHRHYFLEDLDRICPLSRLHIHYLPWSRHCLQFSPPRTHYSMSTMSGDGGVVPQHCHCLDLRARYSHPGSRKESEEHAGGICGMVGSGMA